MTIKTKRLLTRANKLLKNGKPEEAKKLFMLAENESPQNQEAKIGLLAIKNNEKKPELPMEKVQSVVDLFSKNRIKEALIKVKPLINSFPNSPLLFNIRAVCYKANGQLDYAVNDLQKALTLKPNYVEAHYNLGVVLEEHGQVESAIKSYKNAITIKNAYPGAHNNLGNIFLNLGQLGNAIDHFEWAIAFKPNFSEAYNNLGVAFQAQNRNDEAIISFEKALVINPNYVEAHSNLGTICQYFRQTDRAIKCFEKALLVNPNHAKSLFLLGVVFRGLGEISTSVEKFEKALSVNPDYSEVLAHLSEINSYTFSNLHISNIKKLLSSQKTTKRDRINLCFTMAKVNENSGKQKEFFKFLNEGNRLRKDELAYTIDRSQNMFSVIKNIFNQSPIFKKKLSYEKSVIRPIFIVGMPRSGTSLVEQIISSHAEVYGAGELDNIAEMIIPKLKIFSNDASKKLSESDFLSIRKKYLDRLLSFDSSEKIITDKLPLNFRFIGFILLAFPEAKIIHMKRDARATCWSIYKSNFDQQGNAFANNLSDLSKFYDLYAELMDFWHKAFPNKIYDMCYEDLTTNQKEETGKLLEYCDLNWDENCLNFHKSTRAVKTASALQVKQKMYQGSSEAWKKYEAELKPLIMALKKY